MRERLAMDFGWRFHKGDIFVPPVTEFNYYYNHTKAESARGPAAPSFYDGDWEWVDLPHDYGLYEEPDPHCTSAFGFQKRENGWYRKLFRLHPQERGCRICLEFDGVATHCVVWVNGHLMKRNFCGYTSFIVDITEVAEYGELPNLVAVYVDTSDFEGWWYEGAGIYRHVWLIKMAAQAAEPWGIFVCPQKEPENVEADAEKGQFWMVQAELNITNIGYEQEKLSLKTWVEFEQEEKKNFCSGFARRQFAAAPRQTTVVKENIRVENPFLWDVENPVLYKFVAEVFKNGEKIDHAEVQFGFRSIEFHPDRGFLLNGKVVKLKGVCAHEDQANLGTALPDKIREQRMKRLKEIGVNAYRCAHNPPAPETLDWCDRLGILVMDENRWFDSSQEGIRQLESMLRRDRNHPSVILWSMANEEPLQGCEKGRRIMDAMRFAARRLDNSRPIMMAMHSGLLSRGAAAASDVIGINYNEDLYDEVHARFPETALVASEIGGKLNELGVMGDASGEDWEAVNSREFMAGMFKWAAYGYRGEARAWPRLYSRSGIIEATGQWKENSWFYKQMWTKEPFTKIYPEHWNLSCPEQEQQEVRVYTTAEEVTLWLNGRKLGTNKVNPYRRTVFQVPYEPGKLCAVSLSGGKIQSEDVVETTGKGVRIVLKADRERMAADRRDVVTITAGLADEKGRLVLWEEKEVSFHVSDNVTVLAVQNADPYEHLGPKILKRRLYHGSCQLLLLAGSHPGTCRVAASAEGTEEAICSIELEKTVLELHVETDLFTDSLVLFARMSGQN